MYTYTRFVYISLGKNICIYVCMYTYIYIYMYKMHVFIRACISSICICGIRVVEVLGLRAALMLNSIKTTQLIRKWQADLT